MAEPPATDPVAEAQAVVDGALLALVQGDFDRHLTHFAEDVHVVRLSVRTLDAGRGS